MPPFCTEFWSASSDHTGLACGAILWTFTIYVLLKVARLSKNRARRESSWNMLATENISNACMVTVDYSRSISNICRPTDPCPKWDVWVVDDDTEMFKSNVGLRPGITESLRDNMVLSTYFYTKNQIDITIAASSRSSLTSRVGNTVVILQVIRFFLQCD